MSLFQYLTPWKFRKLRVNLFYLNISWIDKPLDTFDYLPCRIFFMYYHCKEYRMGDNCESNCAVISNENRQFSHEFDWRDELIGMLITGPITGFLVYTLILTREIDFALWLLIIGGIFVYLINKVRTMDRVWEFNIDDIGFYVKMGHDIFQGNWEDDPAMYHFPNPTDPSTLILLSKTKNLSPKNLYGGNQNANNMHLGILEISDDEIDLNTKHKSEIKKAFKNYIRRQFEGRNLWYILLKAELNRNPAPGPIRVFNFSNINAPKKLIEASLDPLSNTSKRFRYSYYNNLGKTNSGWELSFDSYHNVCNITILSNSRYEKNKEYEIPIELLEGRHNIILKKPTIGAQKLIIPHQSEWLELKFIPEEHSELFEYLNARSMLVVN